MPRPEYSARFSSACDLADALAAVKGVKVLTSRYFNEIAFETPKHADEVLAALEKKDVIGGVRASRLFPGSGFDNVIIAAATECATDSDIKAYAAALAQVLK